MAVVPPGALAQAVVAQLYRVLTNGDDSVPPPDDNFFSWNTPGTPMQPADLDFLTTGLTSMVTKAAGADGKAAKLTPEQRTALIQAETLARLVDFIPDVTAMNNSQFSKMIASGNGASLSGIYANALKMSQVMQTQLPTEVTTKMEKFRNLLQQVIKTTDVITGEQVEVTVPSSLMQAYNEKHQQYVAAAFDYNTRRLNAMATTDSRAVGDWALNGELYRQQVNAALNDWVINGHKNDVEQIAAYISQISQRDMSVLKSQYLNDLEAARLTSPVSGAEFFVTSLIPGNFATSTAWTPFAFGAGDYERNRSAAVSSSSWPVRAGDGFLGLFGGGGGRTRYAGSLDRSRTAITCEIAEVPIVRQWFQSAFLTSRSWRFDQNNPAVKDTKLCDGASPPKGLLPAYAVSAVFARKLSLSFGKSRTVSNFVAQQEKNCSDGSGYLSFGPFFLGGGAADFNNGTSKRDWGYRYDGNAMSVDGMQLIGFRCHGMPKCPDPDPAIPDNAWV